MLSIECGILEETKAYQIMSSPPVTVTLDSTLQDAARAMYESNVGSVVVVDNENRAVGILTRRDLVFLVGSGQAYRNPRVSSVMSESIITGGEDEDLRSIVNKMKEAGVRHIVIIDSEGRPLGVISLWDILMLLAKACVTE